MKLFVSYNNSKFIKNIILSQIDGLEILSGVYHNNLYRIHQKQHIGCYIFSDKDLQNIEAYKFINDYIDKVKFLVYHTNNNDLILTEFNQCHHLLHNPTNIAANYTLIPNLVNTNIFCMRMDSVIKENSIVSFIDHTDTIPDQLEKILYPNTTLPIKLYSNNIKHYQCLGSLSEFDKAEILYKNKNYLSIDNLYLQEAILCGCDVYSLDTILDQKNINDTIDMKYQSYSTFLTDILI